MIIRLPVSSNPRPPTELALSDYDRTVGQEERERQRGESCFGCPCAMREATVTELAAVI